MATLSTRQSVVPSPSGRAAAAHLGQALQPRPLSLSSRALAGHLGIARRYTDTTSLLTPRRLSPPPPPLPDFNQLRADAQRLQQQVAAHDKARTATPVATQAITPAQAGYPIPFLTPAEQARRRAQSKREHDQLVKRLLANYNSFKSQTYLPEVLRELLMKSTKSLLTQLETTKQATAKTQPVTAAGAGYVPVATASDCFMPFWHTQYQETPKGWKSVYLKGKNGKAGHWTKFNHWRDCCNTCKRLIAKASGSAPGVPVQIVLEVQGKLQPQAGATSGFAKLDEYMTLRKPVMIGVDFMSGTTYNNDNTTEHFVVVVGTGTENGRKYYRFFDVGTADVTKGTNPSFRLYYDSATHSFKGKGLLGTYTITQLRF